MAKKTRPSSANKSKASIVATPSTLADSSSIGKVKAQKVNTKSLKTKFSSKSTQPKGRTINEFPKVTPKSSVTEMAAQYSNLLQIICDDEKANLHETLNELKQENANNNALDELEKDLTSFIDSFLGKFNDQYLQAHASGSKENEPIIFLPEFSLKEFELLNIQQKQLIMNTQFLDVLSQYEQDLNLIRTNENLWIGKLPSTEHEITVSEHVISTSQRYLEILNSMEQSCDKILDLCNATKKQMHQSRDLQDQLYDNFESLRETMTSTEKPSAHIPKDPKDLLKGFPKYLK